MAKSRPAITLETAINWARSGHESDKVYRFLFLHPDDFFTIPDKRQWSIAHQVVFNGDIDLLKRILALFYDDQINIRTLSKDNKTLLDVAKDRKSVHQDMCNYVEDLFHRDDLIEAAKQSNWRLVNDILEKHPELANEKPPYSTFFLLHYIIQNGDENILKDLLNRFRLDRNLVSTDRETPLDLARRLKKNHMCLILEPPTEQRSDSDLVTYRPSLPQNGNSTSTTSLELPYPKADLFPSIDLCNTSIVVTETGNYELQTTSMLSITKIELLSPNQQQQTYLTTEPVDRTKRIDNQGLTADSLVPVTPITPASKSQLLKNLTCPLTQNIFVDPVIASDGQTYERAAIADWVKIYSCSPMTGAKLDATFRDNTEVKQIIQSMRK